MKVNWTLIALDDVEHVVPQQFRVPMLGKLERLAFLGQGRPCTDSRYPDALYVKFEYWYVMFVPVGEDSITVIGVEYNQGQIP